MLHASDLLTWPCWLSTWPCWPSTWPCWLSTWPCWPSTWPCWQVAAVKCRFLCDSRATCFRVVDLTLLTGSSHQDQAPVWFTCYMLQTCRPDLVDDGPDLVDRCSSVHVVAVDMYRTVPCIWFTSVQLWSHCWLLCGTHACLVMLWWELFAPVSYRCKIDNFRHACSQCRGHVPSEQLWIWLPVIFTYLHTS